MFKILKEFFDFCDKENRSKFYKSLVLGVIIALVEATRIPAIAIILHGVLNNSLTTKSILLSFGIVFVGIVIQGFFRYKSTMLQTEAGYTTGANKRVEIAEHMRYLPMGYFNNNSLGKITSVTTNTMESLSDIATRVVMMISIGILNTIVISLLLLFFDWRIGLIIIIGTVIYLAINSFLQKKSADVSVEKVNSDATVVEKVLEYIQGIQEVKSYHLVGPMFKKLNKAIDDNAAINTKMEFVLVPIMMLQNFVSKLIGVMVSVMSLVFYFNGTMDLFYCIMMIVCSFMLTNSLDDAGNYSSLLRSIHLSVEKAQEILDLPPMDIDGEDETPLNYDLDAENITFSYDKKKIIDNVSLHIPQNTTTAIVGPSGGGKTTLCNLLSRFWDVDEGKITLGGKDIREYSMDSLMKNFTFVFQNVTLFHDTVANNIRFGRPEAPMEEVVEAAKKARCHDFIMELPQGYDTVIGEDGGSLSGGERQRISIARAMMKDSPIVILDEATANVDPENEKELMEAIDELTKNKTIIMIAHRLKTVQNADQILVVENGKIVQRGTHNELVSKEGIYKRFVDSRKLATSWKV